MKYVLGILDSETLAVVREVIKPGGWSLSCIDSMRHVEWHTPELVAYIIGEDTRADLFKAVSEWCQVQPRWRAVQKFFISENQDHFGGATVLARAQFQQGLRLHAELQRRTGADSTQNTRTSYRHRCKLKSGVLMDAAIVDLGTGGAQIETKAMIAVGSALKIYISDTDPLLKAVTADVVGVRTLGPGEVCLNLRFTNVTPQIDRALQRYLLSLQTLKRHVL